MQLDCGGGQPIGFIVMKLVTADKERGETVMLTEMYRGQGGGGSLKTR